MTADEGSCSERERGALKSLLLVQLSFFTGATLC